MGILDPVCAGVDGFADSHGPGAKYGCDGSVQGELKFDVCDEADTDTGYNCDPTEGSTRVVPIDSDETEGANGIILFASDDPTGGPLVVACCEDSIEAETGGEEAGDDACMNDCAYAACLNALEKFEALEADPPDDECPQGGIEQQVCEGNIQQSVTFWRTILEDNFSDCVAAAASPDPAHVFYLGNPGCVTNPGGLAGGCFAHGVLDLKCVTAEVNLNTGTSSCTQSKNQPPDTTRASCTYIYGEVELSDGSRSEYPAMKDATATTTYFNCGESSCTLLINSMNFAINDGRYGDVELSDVQVELLYPAAGQSDGADVEFPPGSIWVRVTGTIEDISGSMPFDVVAGSTVPAYGEHDVDSLVLEDVIFEADMFTFTASIDDSDCEEI